MRVLMWHVHGSWTTAFVQGDHEVVLPLAPGRGPEGRGRAQTWDWPPNAREVPVDRLRDEQLDCVVLQRPEEVDLCERWTGRVPGRDLPAVYLEHNTPRGPAVETQHPVVSDPRLRGVTVVHVTDFNALVWDCGDSPTMVIRHGVPDPGYRYTGRDHSVAAVVNEPVRRWRVAGTDLLLGLASEVPVHVYGMGMEPLLKEARRRDVGRLEVHEDVPQSQLHDVLGRHRAYFHPYRWTSLGLSLIEAMMIGLPVLAVAATEAPAAVPPEVGLASSDPRALAAQARRWLDDPIEARSRGRAGREHARATYGLPRFLAEWDLLLKETTR